MILSLIILGCQINVASAQGRAPAWRWVNAPNLYPKVKLQAQRGHTTFVLRQSSTSNHAELRAELSKGGHNHVAWRANVATRRPSLRLGAAMAVSSQTVFVAMFHQYATGCSLYAFSRRNGKQLWATRLQGIGPIKHSKWSNRVQLDLHQGHPVVYGVEGGGNGYIEVRDAATGKLVSNAQHKLSAALPRILAESLYSVLAGALTSSRRYRVSLDAFATRYRWVFSSHANRRVEFQTAAAQLNGLPFGTGHTMTVSLGKGPNGVEHIQAVRK